jgi:hypothetical protein
LLVLAALAEPGALAGPSTLTPAIPGEAVRPRLRVQMQVEPEVELTPADLRAVAQEVGRIWSPVLDVLVAMPGDLARVRAVESVTLTVTSRTLAAGDAIGLGWIEFVNGEPQPAITVSVAAAEHLLREGTWRGVRLHSVPLRISRRFVQRTLARAVAHEIGHYLLRSTMHDRQGLMRPVFSVDEIMDGRASLVRLSASDIARLRSNEALYARAGGIRDQGPGIREAP